MSGDSITATMRHRLLPITAVALFAAALIYPVHGQQAQGSQAAPGSGGTPAAQGQGDQGSRGARGGGQGQGRGGRGTRGGGDQQNPGANGTVGGVGGPRGRGPAGPAPRNAAGRAMLGWVNPADKGVWLPGAGGFQAITADDVPIPMQPWARGVLADRQRNQLEPHTRCKPSGVSRQFLTPYGVEIVELPEMKRVYIFDIGGPHTYRTIYLDGRTHPANLPPSYYGHSIGWYEGDTLVVDTVGFNEGFWIDRRGTPHTEQLHTLERFTRTDARTIKYELTIGDPGAFTASWNAGFNLGLESGTELFEYVCQQANYADNLMVGEHTSVDRTTPIVP
jgi:hypothetical protein